ncbi:ATP-dependent DNA helicase MER3 [Coprinopsis cinerea okayama7|uniref:DNA 3'-5' helicase n=1 Tax=Coprinopsis cinerea (strain Okayama-7 / 130 / ATCC MYA-4618 / FGSC 9003) TaxID=240176 RepID=A8NEK3_COPC7|nr:ATP-dependent DNA helicase MER3 [Coprinopsis cinerea okayama7\|eukprot:XP_001833055.2 ATP-dependent DNA helicase MER3 [Coprinopsis cinerea okayama7\
MSSFNPNRWSATTSAFRSRVQQNTFTQQPEIKAGSISPILDDYYDDLNMQYVDSSPSPFSRGNSFGDFESGTAQTFHSVHHLAQYDQPHNSLYRGDQFHEDELEGQRQDYSEEHTYHYERQRHDSPQQRSSQLQERYPPSVPCYNFTRRAGQSAHSDDNHLNREEGRIKLKPVSQLPDIYRAIFKKYGSFNAIQSACFDDLMQTDENLVISAPTGSGKTVLFELAMIRLQMQNRSGSRPSKCVYIAPTKALCTEKFNDWNTKFAPIGCELTGDTSVFGRDIWTQAKDASIIVTTGEKWDSLTRNWYRFSSPLTAGLTLARSDHERIFSLVHLLLVDEVHVLGETRGSTLEVVVSRMKLRGSATRFVLVSATVPNIEDIAAWIGNSKKSGPARVLKFGEEYRPCKLAKHVIGFGRRKEQNDFQFARVLDSKLFGVIQHHSAGKPILVFVNTRKGVFQTAEQLMKEYKECETKRLPVPWTHPSRVDTSFHDKKLTELVSYGIGVHHAGLTMEDRRAIEQLYIQKLIRVLVTTSTLAVGVNLPAHLVIIRGVQTFQNGVSVEYSDLDVMQMLGRAGRPQFDTEGTAVIMCESELAPKYEALTQGTTVLESSLHRNLAEHINSEIGLGTITSIESAKAWLRESFLFQRLQKNPSWYSIDNENGDATWQERLDNVVLKSIEQLQANKLVQFKSGSSLKTLASTEYGEIMSKFYIRQNTMVDILATPPNASLRDLLELISRADEFSESKPRATEKTVCNNLRKHPDIRFEVRKVESAADKAFVLIQAVLGGISLNSPEYHTSDCQLTLEAFGIFRHVDRIARAIVEVAIVRKYGRQVKDGTELVRCLASKAWEDRPVVLRQIEHLGEKSIKILAENGITTLDKLRAQNPIRLEALLNRKPGFGHEILGLVNALPRYEVKLKEIALQADGKSDVEVELAVECQLLNGDTFATGSKKSKNRGFNMTAILTISSDMELLDFRRIQTKALKTGKSFTVNTTLTKPSQSITVIVASELVAGTAIQAQYKPDVPPSAFRTLVTKPCSSLEMDLAGLEEDPDFWNMNIDDSSEDAKVEHAKTEPVKVEPVVRRAPKSPPPRSRLLQETSIALPRKMANGAYDCKHGLPKPPNASKASKGKENTATAKHWKEEEPVKVSKVQRLHSKPTKSAADTRAQKSLQELHDLHDKLNTSERLRISSGQRLKLDSLEFLMKDDLNSRPKKRLPQPTIDLKLSDIGETEAAAATMIDFDDMIEEDDDDIPLEIGNALSLRRPSDRLPTPKKRALSISSESEDEPKTIPAKRTKKLLQDKEDSIEAFTRPSSPVALFLPSSSSERNEDEPQPNAAEDDIEAFFTVHSEDCGQPVTEEATNPPPATAIEDNVQAGNIHTITPTLVTQPTPISERPKEDTAVDNFYEEWEDWVYNSGEVKLVPLE